MLKGRRRRHLAINAALPLTLYTLHVEKFPHVRSMVETGTLLFSSHHLITCLTSLHLPACLVAGVQRALWTYRGGPGQYSAYVCHILPAWRTTILLYFPGNKAHKQVRHILQDPPKETRWRCREAGTSSYHSPFHQPHPSLVLPSSTYLLCFSKHLHSRGMPV